MTKAAHRPKPTTPGTKPEKQKRPLTAALMKRISRIIEKSNGKLTVTSLARDIRKTQQEVSEYLGGYRSHPNGETALAITRWADKNENGATQVRKGASV